MRPLLRLRRRLRRPRVGLAVGAPFAAALLAAGCAPPPSAPGNGADFALNYQAGQVIRWNPCAPVHYRVDAHLVPWAAGEAQAAVQRLSQATGITFVYDGPTTFVPQPGQDGNQPAPLVISFTHPAGYAGGSAWLTGGNQVGEGGWWAQGIPSGGRTVWRITAGYAALNADRWGGLSTGEQNSTLLHELGHAVGLDHARFSSEVMYSVISAATPPYYAAGDLTGLRLVGRSAGCM